MSLTKTAPSKQKFFFRVQTRRLAASFETFTRSVRAYQTREISTQYHVRLGVFFSENPRNQPDAKELSIFRIKKLFLNPQTHIFTA